MNTSDYSLYELGTEDYTWNGTVLPPRVPKYELYSPLAAIATRLGLTLLQGAAPTSSIATALTHNLLDLGVSTIVFATIGRHISFPEENISDHFMEGWTLLIITMGLVTIAIADRVFLITTLIISSLFSGVIYPLLYKWSMTSPSWMTNSTVLGKDVYFFDKGGMIMININAGFAATIGIVFLGRRLMRLKDIDFAYSYSPLSLLLGYFLVIFGLTIYYVAGNVVHLNVFGLNVIIALASALLTALALKLLEPRVSMEIGLVQKCLQCATAALVVILPIADITSTTISGVLGIVASIITLSVDFVLNFTYINDYHNIIGVHLMPAIIIYLSGHILMKFNKEVKEAFAQAFWVAVCILASLGLILIFFLPIFLVMDVCHLLRNPHEENANQRGLVISILQNRRYKRLIEPSKSTILTPDLIVERIATRTSKLVH